MCWLVINNPMKIINDFQSTKKIEIEKKLFFY